METLVGSSGVETKAFALLPQTEGSKENRLRGEGGPTRTSNAYFP